MACSFVSELSKLRKLSMESVENTSSFDEYKLYLHVQRPVEEELRSLLIRINSENKKTLVLLCGSAGDGKSHLLSYLRNADPANLLSKFNEIYNDATESSAPTLTAIDTLAEKLKPFDDDHFQNDDGFKMILAINLGTLNNFIESEKGKVFSALKKYVEANEIFSSSLQAVHTTSYHPGSVFQHVSFADYQVFSLTENGIKTEYLDSLFSRIFTPSNQNPFYQAYIINSGCALCQKCPVRDNFEFMSNPKHQKALIKKIVEVVIKDKALVSTRDVLNLIYDILVHPDFSYSDFCKAIPETEYLKKHIQYTTPMLLYEYEGISPLIDALRLHDKLKDRQESMDENATRFHSLENIYDAFSEATSGTPYDRLKEKTKIDVLGAMKPDLKKRVYKFIVRTKELKSDYPESAQDERFSEYIKYLFYQNSGKEKKLRGLYESTQKAILNWNGEFDSDLICIDDSNEKFWVLEHLYIKPQIYNYSIPETDEVRRFSTTIMLRFNKDGDPNQNAEISIDYALYEMISDMRAGYRPTVQDKNRHADFLSFVQRIIEFGNKESRIELIPKDNEHDYRATFEATSFGHEFRVVKI